MAVQLYNKDHLPINPLSHSTAIMDDTYGTVANNLAALWETLEQNDPEGGAVNNIRITVTYCKTDIKDEADIKKITTWEPGFEVPDEENPYVWKKTEYSYGGSTNITTVYEIVSSDVSTVIQNIYTRTDEKTTPLIEYKWKQNDKGEYLYLDALDKETTTPTGKKAYDYNYYYDGTPANKIDSLPPTPNKPGTSEQGNYEWTDYPRDISPSFPRVFMSRRIRQSGKWGAFSTPAQYGQWPTNITS